MIREHDHYENLARQVLLRHELPAPARIAADDVAESLARQAAQMIDDDAFLRHLAERSGDALAMRHELSRLELPPSLAAMLAHARERRPVLFRHLLLVALIAHYLALRRELAAREAHAVLLAALCHDLGELYTDPALLDPRHRIGDDERRFIYVHPITGHLIARDIMELEPAIAAAVLQHQERLDGSGYPYGLRAERIGPYARIVGLADVCAAILARFRSHERLGALMRLNRQKFDIGLLALLHEGVGHAGAEPSPPRVAVPHRRLAAAAALLERWDEFRPALAYGRDGRSVAELTFLVERMATLRHMLLQFGFDPASQQLLAELLSEDDEVAAELDAALDEVHWQFQDLQREMTRRRETVEPLLNADARRLLDEWTGQLRAYLEMAGD
ncbi:MAG TPA: HD domain-containing phosphohydrolase [Rhodocyclaceae bacterium]